jgi:hypothetical protein
MHNTYLRWSENDIAKLKALAQKYRVAMIAQQLGRSVSTVSKKARQLKLSLRVKRPKR